MWITIYLLVIVANVVGAALAISGIRNSRGLIHMQSEARGFYRRRAWGWLAMHLVYITFALAAVVGAVG